VLSLLNLAFRFNLHVLKKPFVGSGPGREAFLEQYGAENLLPLSEEARRILPGLQSCICCGLCDTVCERLEAAERHIYNGPSELAFSLTRNLPAYQWIEQHLQIWQTCGECRACEEVCPAGVPLRELVSFAREQIKAILEVTP
jgi:heterodisulfide reductase subunit C